MANPYRLGQGWLAWRRVDRALPVAAALLPVLLLPLLLHNDASTVPAMGARASASMLVSAAEPSSSAPSTATAATGTSDDVTAASAAAEYTASISDTSPDIGPLLRVRDLAAELFGPAAEAVPESMFPVDLPQQPQAVRPLLELSPAAMSFAAQRDGDVSVFVLDLDGESAFALRADARYPLASVIKVPMLLAALKLEEEMQLEVTARQRRILREMIVNSDNDATNQTWRWLGRADTLNTFFGELGFDEGRFEIAKDWGESTASVTDVAALFAELAIGERISPSVREQTFALLYDVIPDQRFGAIAGLAAAQPDWRIALKNGWYPESLRSWRVHSAGIISDETDAPRYVVVIMTSGQPSFSYGIATVEGVAREINRALAAGLAEPQAGS